MSVANLVPNIFQEQYGFVYADNNGTMFSITQASIYTIGAIAIAAIASIGCCCTKWCAKPDTHIINLPPPPPKEELKKSTISQICDKSITLLHVYLITKDFVNIFSRKN